MSDSVRPHRWQPTRLCRSWDSPGKNTGVGCHFLLQCMNTGVGCHFLLQCMKVKSESEVIPSCPTLRDPMDCSLPCSTIHGIFQARVLERVAIAFSVIFPDPLTMDIFSSLILPQASCFRGLYVFSSFEDIKLSYSYTTAHFSCTFHDAPYKHNRKRFLNM